MDLLALGKKIASLGAPILGASIGGPVGAAVARGVAGFLGLSDSSPEALATALANPEIASKIIELEKISYEREKDRYADVANARQRDAEVVKASGKTEWVMHFMVIAAWVGYYTILLLNSQHYLVFKFDKDTIVDLKDIVLGISGFYFGNLFRKYNGGGFTNVSL